MFSEQLAPLTASSY